MGIDTYIYHVRIIVKFRFITLVLSVRATAVEERLEVVALGGKDELVDGERLVRAEDSEVGGYVLGGAEVLDNGRHRRQFRDFWHDSLR